MTRCPSRISSVYLRQNKYLVTTSDISQTSNQTKEHECQTERKNKEDIYTSNTVHAKKKKRLPSESNRAANDNQRKQED